MVGITLSPEQMKSAPPEVRAWLEHEIMASLGFGMGTEMSAGYPQLAVCSAQEAEAVYDTISGMFAVVTVFFELGREGAGMAQGDMEAFRLSDMLRHTRLPSMQQFLACLQLIDRTFREIRRNDDAALFVLDRRGYCVVPAETQRNILSVWNRLIGLQESERRANADAMKPDTALPFATSGTVPPSSIHLDGVFPEASARGQPTIANGPNRQ